MSPSFWRFLSYARPYKGLISGGIVTGILKFTLALAIPAALGYVIDYVIVPAAADLSWDDRVQRLWGVVIIFTLVFVARAFMTYLRSYLSELAGNRIVFDIRRDLFRHVQRLSLAYHANRRTGNTMSRIINDLNTAQGILQEGVISVCIDFIFLIGVVIFLFIWDWRLAFVSLFTLPFYGVVFRAINPRLREVSIHVQQEMEELSGEVTEKLSGLPVVQSFAREKTEEINFFRRHRRYYTSKMRQVRLRMILTSVAEFLTAFGPILVITYGGYRVLADIRAGVPDPFTVGQLVTFNGFLAHLYLPTRRLADYSAVLQEKLAAMDRVFEVFDTEPDIEDRPDARPLAHVRGHLEFNAVRFGYNPGAPVLDGVSMVIEPGQSVAIVGQSGAGKSTLVNLVPRFYDVWDGTIRVDGHDIRGVTLRSLRDHIGMVLQDTILFSGTIRDNILYGRPGATEAAMLRAAEMAHVHEFVSAMPQGYDTLIGERGVKLSGGQKQRLSIARAFLRDPRILILDEATSSLDSHAENIIQEALAELMKGRTTLVIAHRLSTVVDCDFVAVLSAGRVVQCGPHRELIHLHGPYRDFCKDQFGAIDAEGLSHRAAG